MRDTGYLPSEGERAAQRSWKRLGRTGASVRSKIVLGAAVLAIALGGAYLADVPLRKTDDNLAAPAPVRVQLEPTSSAGANPFMPPVGQDQAGVTVPPDAGGQFPGNTPGLFAEDEGTPSCDVQNLIANLRADQGKAAAWAQALGINVDGIPGYVASLTPVVLRSDTAVTSYGYENGTFVAYPAVLQAGTAVFVNGQGLPRVKCHSGNPLDEPQPVDKADYRGPSWQTFTPRAITHVHPAPTVINNIVVVDVHHHDRWHHRPVPPQWHEDHGGYCKKHHDPNKCQDHDRKPNPGHQQPGDYRPSDNRPADYTRPVPLPIPGPPGPGEHKPAPDKLAQQAKSDEPTPRAKRDRSHVKRQKHTQRKTAGTACETKSKSKRCVQGSK